MIGVVEMEAGREGGVPVVAPPVADDNRMRVLESRLVALEEAARQGLDARQGLGQELDAGLVDEIEQGLDDGLGQGQWLELDTGLDTGPGLGQRPGHEDKTSSLLPPSSSSRPRMTKRLIPITASTTNPPPPGIRSAPH